MNESEPLMTRRNPSNDIKTRLERKSGKSSEGTYLLSERCPAFRWHELPAGFDMELGNLRPQCKSKNASGTTVSVKVEKCGQGAELLVVATKSVKTDGAKGQRHSVMRFCQPQGRSRNA